MGTTERGLANLPSSASIASTVAEEKKKGCKMNEKMSRAEDRFKAKNKSVTIKGKGANVPLSAGFWHRQLDRGATEKGEQYRRSERCQSWPAYT